MDIRAILVAFGTLLLGAVLGELLPTDRAWVMWAIVLTAGCFAGAVLLSVTSVRSRVPWLRTDRDRDAALVKRLGEELDTCHSLQREVGPLKDEAEAIADVRQRTEAWATAVRDLLDKERPGWSAVFLSNPVHIQFGSQFVERDRVRNYLQQREATLMELIARLG